MQHQVDQDNILREKLIYRYVQAMDRGDVQKIAAVLEAALNDPELDRIITEIDLAYQEGEDSVIHHVIPSAMLRTDLNVTLSCTYIGMSRFA